MASHPAPFPLPPKAADASLRRLVSFFEELSPADLDRLGDIYCEDAFFKDPFNEVTGLAAIRCIFAHMFATLRSPRFRITGTIPGAREAMVAWEFQCLQGRRARPLSLRGVSHLKFAPDGRISSHRDYWDTAEELYMKLPWIGGLLRILRRLLAAPNDRRPKTLGHWQSTEDRK